MFSLSTEIIIFTSDHLYNNSILLLHLENPVCLGLCFPLIKSLWHQVPLMSFQMTQGSLTRTSQCTWDPKTSHFLNSKFLRTNQHDDIVCMHACILTSNGKYFWQIKLPRGGIHRSNMRTITGKIKLVPNKNCLIGFGNVDIEDKVQQEHVKISRPWLLF